MNSEISIEKIIEAANQFFELFRDEVVFLAFQVSIVITLLYAIYRSNQESYRNKNRGLHLSVKRGKKSVSYFHHCSTFFVTAVLAVVFNITDVARGYKIFIFLVNVAVVLYLSYWNNWSRNKTVGLFGMIQNKIEE